MQARAGTTEQVYGWLVAYHGVGRHSDLRHHADLLVDYGRRRAASSIRRATWKLDAKLHAGARRTFITIAVRWDHEVHHRESPIVVELATDAGARQLMRALAGRYEPSPGLMSFSSSNVDWIAGNVRAKSFVRHEARTTGLDGVHQRVLGVTDAEPFAEEDPDDDRIALTEEVIADEDVDRACALLSDKRKLVAITRIRHQDPGVTWPQVSVALAAQDLVMSAGAAKRAFSRLADPQDPIHAKRPGLDATLFQRLQTHPRRARAAAARAAQDGIVEAAAAEGTTLVPPRLAPPPRDPVEADRRVRHAQDGAERRLAELETDDRTAAFVVIAWAQDIATDRVLAELLGRHRRVVRGKELTEIRRLVLGPLTDPERQALRIVGQQRDWP